MSRELLELNNIGMRFRLHFERNYTLKEVLVNAVRRKNAYRDLWALKNINLKVNRGESVGIIGRNGSGKSTLLKIIAGVYEPTTGIRSIHGSVAALIELGAGFNGELTGRENVFLNGAIMARTKAEMLERYDRIVDFAELREFMDTPVKNYSSGMYARLGFSIATDVEADILLIDEILGVGDEAFQKKSMSRIEDLLRASKTVVFVSHNTDAVQEICTRAILLVDGEVKFEGNTKETIAEYHKFLGDGRGYV